MAEYIKKEDAIKLIREDKVEITPNLLTIAMLAAPNGYSAEDCYKAINDTSDRHIKEIRNLPAANVVERRTGKWVGGELGYCTCCGYRGCASDMWADGEVNFCPHCGAKMMGEDNG